MISALYLFVDFLGVVLFSAESVSVVMPTVRHTPSRSCSHPISVAVPYITRVVYILIIFFHFWGRRVVCLFVCGAILLLRCFIYR